MKNQALKLGTKHTVDGTLCIVKFINQNIGFLFPIIDDPDDGMVARHICLGKVYSNGRIVKV